MFDVQQNIIHISIIFLGKPLLLLHNINYLIIIILTFDMKPKVLEVIRMHYNIIATYFYLCNRGAADLIVLWCRRFVAWRWSSSTADSRAVPTGSDSGTSARPPLSMCRSSKSLRCAARMPPKESAVRTMLTPPCADNAYTTAANTISWHEHVNAWQPKFAGFGGGSTSTAYHVAATVTVNATIVTAAATSVDVGGIVDDTFTRLRWRLL